MALFNKTISSFTKKLIIANIVTYTVVIALQVL